jgi:hypothetical protein
MLGNKFREKYHRASLIILDQAGYILQIEQENLFNLLVKKWLERKLSVFKHNSYVVKHKC